MKNIYLVIVFITTVLYCSTTVNSNNEPLPILYWHSAGESCCETEYELYSTVIRKYLGTSVYIKSVQIGTSVTTDKFLSLKMHPFEQIKIVCEDIKKDEKFRNGYNGIGLSQGALLLRGLVQACEGGPRMRNLISLGGPHQGVYEYPNCGAISSVLCSILIFQMNRLIYSRPSQNFLAPTTYWHDIVEKRYLRGSTFLAVINNELLINESYKNNLKSLNKFVMVKYEQDSSIIPNDSSFFAYYDVFKNIVPLQASSLYYHDKLGLREMDVNKQLVFLTSPGSHLELVENWFVENIVPFLKD